MVMRRRQTPVWLKGVINPEDALRAVDVGAAGIIVSTTRT